MDAGALDKLKYLASAQDFTTQKEYLNFIGTIYGFSMDSKNPILNLHQTRCERI